MAVERRTLPGLVRLLESGRLTIPELTDQELERIVSDVPPGEPDVRDLTDEELAAIIRGDWGGAYDRQSPGIPNTL